MEPGVAYLQDPVHDGDLRRDSDTSYLITGTGRRAIEA